VAGRSENPGELSCSYAALVSDLQVNDAVLLADGAVAMRVVAKGDGYAEVEVTLPGEIRSRHGINAPGVRLQIASLTEKDRRDLDWTARHDIDYVGLSFVRRPADVEDLREELVRRGSQAQIIAKIEKPEAVEQLDAIIQASDGIMVARGDLGVEIDVARVPMVQKHVLRRCHHFGVPVITATQMLESMRTSNRPTRAEASDVANAILDGTDAVMLSGETAMGQYPVEAVETMNRIAQETEREASAFRHATKSDGPALGPAAPITHAAVEAAALLAERVSARLIIAATHAGHTALSLSKQRVLTPILGLSDQPDTVRRLALYWGVMPVLFQKPRVPTEYVEQVIVWVREQQLAQPGDRLVFVFGSHWTGASSSTTLVHEVG
jgi:pyruvate kinase